MPDAGVGSRPRAAGGATRLSGLLALLVLAAPLAQGPDVVAESQATGQWGVAPLQVRLNWQRRYALQIDGPPGVPFSASYFQVYVSHEADRGGSGNDDGRFEGETPYERDLVAPASQLLFWRYSVVVSPKAPAELVARVVDRGPQ